MTAYSEDFTRPAALGQVGAVYGQSMRGYDGFTDTSKQGTYSPDKVLSVHDGMLDYHLHSEAGKPLVAAPVVEDYTGRTTARYTVRLKADRIPGYKIAFLLWPSSNDWNDGEIDWPEVGSLNDEKASPANAVPGSAAKYGYQKADFLPATRAYAPFTLQSGFHDYVIERTPGQLRFYADNTLVATITGAGVPTTAFRWTLQAETVIGAPANTTTSGHLYVDRLTVETR